MDIVVIAVLKTMVWMAAINIMVAALELFSMIGYIMYHRGIRADGDATQVIQMKTMSSVMTPATPSQPHPDNQSPNDRSFQPLPTSVSDTSFVGGNNNNKSKLGYLGKEFNINFYLTSFFNLNFSSNSFFCQSFICEVPTSPPNNC
jgi:hypothetical protein